MKRVLVTDGLSPVGVDYLRKEGLEVDTVPTLAEAELVARLRGLHGLIVRSATRVTRAVVEAGRDLVVIGRAGAGVDNIDVDAATERGVIVMNTPGPDRRRQRGLVDDPAPRTVDDPHARLHPRELRLVDEVPRVLTERGVDRDEVRPLEQIVELDALDAQALGGLTRQIGIVGDHLQAETERPARDLGADPAEATTPRILL